VTAADDTLFVCVDVEEDVIVCENKSSSPSPSLTEEAVETLEEDFMNDVKRFAVEVIEFFFDFTSEEGKLA